MTTKDGYILKLFRIMNNRVQNGEKAPVVFLQHGLYGTALEFLDNDSDKALPFQFANKGYDVWLGNNRGNKYSDKHVSLN